MEYENKAQSIHTAYCEQNFPVFLVQDYIDTENTIKDIKKYYRHTLLASLILQPIMSSKKPYVDKVIRNKRSTYLCIQIKNH